LKAKDAKSRTMVEATDPITVTMRHMVGRPTTAFAAIDSIDPVRRSLAI
jgi:hypothetical protein